MANKVIKIKATNKIAWGILVAIIGVAIFAIIYKNKQTSYNDIKKDEEFLNKIPAIAKYIPSNIVETIGAAAIISLITIVVYSGEITALYKLRNYKLEKISDKHIRIIKD